MSKIKKIEAWEILDSRGVPTVAVKVETEDGFKAQAQVPSGASTGESEAWELRDGDKTRYFGKGVLKAVENVKKIEEILIGEEVENQEEIDKKMIELDGALNKSSVGANAILGVSMAGIKAGAMSAGLELYEYIGRIYGNGIFSLPEPMILILEGGKHGNWAMDCQEYMVIPRGERFETFSEKLQAGAEIFKSLGEILNEKQYSIGVGFEGAYMPKEIGSNKEAFELMMRAIEKAGYKPGMQVGLAVDAASSEFFDKESGNYVLKSEENKELTEKEWMEKLEEWIEKYPLWSMEDGFDQEGWNVWAEFNKKQGSKVQVVGDDLLTTNVERIKKAIEMKACNSVLIKPNQIGTMTETFKAMKLAQENGLKLIVSHRGGETNDSLIADLAVGTGAGQCKFGGPDRGERLAKYNRLLRIEKDLEKK